MDTIKVSAKEFMDKIEVMTQATLEGHHFFEIEAKLKSTTNRKFKEYQGLYGYITMLIADLDTMELEENTAVRFDSIKVWLRTSTVQSVKYFLNQSDAPYKGILELTTQNSVYVFYLRLKGDIGAVMTLSGRNPNDLDSVS